MAEAMTTPTTSTVVTAAAEEDSPNPVLFLAKQLAEKQRQLDSTIERCAQVAERFAEGGACAAAIRRLKDQS